MKKRSVAARLVAVAAALLAGLAVAGGAHASGAGSTPPSLTEDVPGCTGAAATLRCPDLFAGAPPLYPGAPAITRTVRLSYHGSGGSAPRLYASRLVRRAAAASTLCTAPDPAAGFHLTVRSGAVQLFDGTLANFAAGHGEPAGGIALPGRWADGDSHPVTLAVTMPRGAGNEYMGCATQVDFSWVTA